MMKYNYMKTETDFPTWHSALLRNHASLCSTLYMYNLKNEKVITVILHWRQAMSCDKLIYRYVSGWNYLK